MDKGTQQFLARRRPEDNWNFRVQPYADESAHVMWLRDLGATDFDDLAAVNEIGAQIIGAGNPAGVV